MPTIRDRFLGPPIPTYRKHKPSGQAVVTLNGKDFYLGPHNSRASRAEYDRLIGQWLAAGRCLPAALAGDDLSVAEVALAYLRFAKQYYRGLDGKPTGSLDRVIGAVKVLRQKYGPTAARDFGPLALQALQQHLAGPGITRKYVNYLIATIKRLFRWAASQELIPVAVYHGLATVAGLKIGRTDARETEPVRPVADDVVDATLPQLPAEIAAMVQLQRLTGCRPAEVCLLRPSDVDRSGEVWEFRPQAHKTAYRGRQRVIFLGPKAQAVLLPWLLREPASYCFAPCERVEKLNRQRRADRQSPMTPSQAKRRRKRQPQRAPGLCYTSESYRQVIRRTIAAQNRQCEKKGEALLPDWRPNQLRHAAATEIRKQFGGLEPVAAVLGHAHMNVSEIYAEKNLGLAAEIMRKIG